MKHACYEDEERISSALQGSDCVLRCAARKFANIDDLCDVDLQ